MAMPRCCVARMRAERILTLVSGSSIEWHLQRLAELKLSDIA